MKVELELVERHLARGALDEAIAALLPALEARSADRICALAARALRARDGSAFAPDAMAAALDRLMALVRAQDAQIAQLRALVETAL